MTQLRSRLFSGAGILAGIVFLIAAPYLVDKTYLSILNEIIIYGLLAMGLNILMGYTGLTSLGHAAIFGVAAYTCAYLTVDKHTSFVPTFLMGIFMATAVSVVFALVATRATGTYFLMITLAVNSLAFGLTYSLYNYTNGDNGLGVVARPDFLKQDYMYFWFSALVLIVCIVLIWRIVHSPFGLVLMGIRESESRMRTLGYNVTLHKILGFVVSGFFAGVAGCLYAYWQQFVSNDIVTNQPSILALLMVIIGGTGTLFGPLLGSVIIVYLKETVSLYTDRWETVLGVVLVLVIIFARNGILGTAAQYLRRRRRISTEAAAGLQPVTPHSEIAKTNGYAASGVPGWSGSASLAPEGPTQGVVPPSAGQQIEVDPPPREGSGTTAS